MNFLLVCLFLAIICLFVESWLSILDVFFVYSINYVGQLLDICQNFIFHIPVFYCGKVLHGQRESARGHP